MAAWGHIGFALFLILQAELDFDFTIFYCAHEKKLGWCPQTRPLGRSPGPSIPCLLSMEPLLVSCVTATIRDEVLQSVTSRVAQTRTWALRASSMEEVV